MTATAESTTTTTSSPTTYLPLRDPDAPPAVPRESLGKPTLDERFVAWGAWISALGLTWIITQRLLPLDGLPWFLVVWFLTGLLASAVLTAMTGRAVDVSDRIVRAIVTVLTGVVVLSLVSVVVFTFTGSAGDGAPHGYDALFHWNFFTEDMSGVGPKDGFDRGGILHAIVGSLIQLTIALLISLPLGIGTAIFMTEVGGPFAKVVRTIVEAMTALPSIVAGLFIYTVFIIILGAPRSGLAAGLAIAVMMLPIIARAADVVLRVVPGNLREASLGLGASRWKTVWQVVLPTARPGLATAVILGVARGIGETSPVLLTSGAAPFLVTNPTDGVMNSLPLAIYTTVRSGEPNAIARAFATATVLMVLVLILFITARLLARPRTAVRRRPLRSLTSALIPAIPLRSTNDVPLDSPEETRS